MSLFHYSQYAKQIFQHLIRQGQFDAALKKYVSSNDVRNLQKFLDNLTSEVSETLGIYTQNLIIYV